MKELESQKLSLKDDINSIRQEMESSQAYLDSIKSKEVETVGIENELIRQIDDLVE